MPFSKDKKRGCPTCSGKDAKSCVRCNGKTKMCDWHYTKNGWAHISELSIDEMSELGLAI